MAIKDFSKWLAHPALQPQNMTALLVDWTSFYIFISDE